MYLVWSEPGDVASGEKPLQRGCSSGGKGPVAKARGRFILLWICMLHRLALASKGVGQCGATKRTLRSPTHILT